MINSSERGLYEDQPGKGRYLQALRRHWRLIALLVVLAVGAAAAYSLTAAKQYEAEADILVTPFTESSDTFAGLNVLRDPTSSVYTAARLVKEPGVSVAVARRLHNEMTPKALLDSIKVKPLQQSQIIAVVAKSRSPSHAAAIANAFADVTLAQRTQTFQKDLRAAIGRVRGRLAETEGLSLGEKLGLQSQLGALSALVGAKDPTLDIFSQAVPPEKPSSPRPVLSVIVALLASLLLGGAAALILELLNPRVTDENELIERVPILAWIPRARRSVVRKYLRGREALPPDLWEAYRTLRSGLIGGGSGNESCRTVLVTSAIKSEGKTMTSVNLAIALAAAGARVVLVDGDLRRPMVASVFGLEAPTAGLSRLLFGRTSAEETLVPAPGYEDRLRLLLAGSERPIDLLEPRRVDAVLAELEQNADIVIIDSPPVTEFADAFVLAKAVDTVLIAVRLGHTRRDKFNELRRFLSQRGITPAGFVVTSHGQRSRGRGMPPAFEDQAAASPAPWLSDASTRQAAASDARTRVG